MDVVLEYTLCSKNIQKCKFIFRSEILFGKINDFNKKYRWINFVFYFENWNFCAQPYRTKINATKKWHTDFTPPFKTCVLFDGV